MKTLTCKNPNCRREFVPDSDHRCLPYCCAMCAREGNTVKSFPQPKRGPARLPDTAMTVIAKPLPQRKHGADRRD